MASGRTVRGVVIAVCWLAAACSEVLGFKDPTVDDNALPADARPSTDGSTGGPDAGCSACRFGCDPVSSACRPEKLWIFKTTGATLGNAFGGTDNPPNVRAGADGRCVATYMAQHTARQCATGNIHAVLHVSSADTIALMASRYGIPVDVPVHRADDDVRVTAHWNHLVDPTRILDAPATTAPTEDAGIVWSGSPSASCQNWTSALSTDSGARAYTTRTTATWLTQDTFRCDRLAALLCICWPEGS